MPENPLKKTEWIMLSNKHIFYPLEPDLELIDIGDIATSLSLICRYIGKIKAHYSVAEHSIHISHIVSPQNAFWGLMHDAAEAYVGDMPYPIKLYLPDFVKIENRILKLIAEKFNLVWPAPKEVKTADTNIIADEMFRFFGYTGTFKKERLATGTKIFGWSANQARILFLKRFFELYKKLPE